MSEGDQNKIDTFPRFASFDQKDKDLATVASNFCFCLALIDGEKLTFAVFATKFFLDSLLMLDSVL
jgi:hypothetical protein